MALDILRHPCFSDAARHRFARIHLPVAPDCNIQCNFCKRVYDCANESRPGVTTAVLSPKQALALPGGRAEEGPADHGRGNCRAGRPVRHARQDAGNVATGARASSRDAALRGVERIGRRALCRRLGVVGGKPCHAYRQRRRPGRSAPRSTPGFATESEFTAARSAAQLLWDRQAAAIRALKDRGITVKINTIIVPGVNDHHVVEVARRVAELGADIANCVPLYPVAGTAVRRGAAAGAGDGGRHPRGSGPAPAHHGTLHPMPCRRGRAAGRTHAAGDRNVPAAIGRHARQSRGRSTLRGRGHPGRRAGQPTPRRSGTDRRVWTGRARASVWWKCGRRRRPAADRNVGRPWPRRSRTAGHCWSPAPASRPVRRSPSQGIQVIMMEGLIEEGLEAVYRGVPIRAPLRKQHRCGSGCAGNGLGCS